MAGIEYDLEGVVHSGNREATRNCLWWSLVCVAETVGQLEVSFGVSVGGVADAGGVKVAENREIVCAMSPTEPPAENTPGCEKRTTNSNLKGEFHG